MKKTMYEETKQKNKAFKKSCGMSTRELSVKEATKLLLKTKVALKLESCIKNGGMPVLNIMLITFKKKTEIDKELNECYAFEKNQPIIKVCLIPKQLSDSNPLK